MTADRRERIRAAYDAVADAYKERLFHELDYKPYDRALLDAYARDVRGTVVEVGCGPGQVGRYLAGRGVRVVGLDLSPAMAALARETLGACVVADMLAIPFADGCLGGAVAFYSLIHLPREQLADAFAEMRRVVRPGGRIVVAVHEGEGDAHVENWFDRGVSIDASFFSREELIGAATATGLAVRSCEARQPYEQEGATRRLYLVAQALP